MSVSRREFLKLFSYSALAAIAPINQLGIFSNDTFRSDIFGFSISIPSRWYKVTPDSFIWSIKNNLYPDGEVLDPYSYPTPITGAFHREEPSPDLNSYFFVFADRRRPNIEQSAYGFHETRLNEYLDEILAPTVVQNTASIELGGIEAATTTVQCRQPTRNGVSELAIGRFFTVFHGEYVIVVEVGDYADQSKSARQTLDKTLRSISFF